MNQSELNSLSICEQAVQLVPESIARENSVLPVRVTRDTLHVVLPTDHYKTPSQIAELLNFVVGHTIAYDTASLNDLAPLIAVHYSVTYAAVSNCEQKFVTKCPRRWSELETTEDTQIRSCSVCRKNVYFCRTDLEIKHHAKLGHCIAIIDIDPFAETLGMPHTSD